MSDPVALVEALVEVPTFIATLGSLFLVAGALALAAAIFRTSTFRNTIADQAAAITALRERVEVAEADKAMANARITVLEAEVLDLRRTKEILAREVTGSAKLAEVVRFQVEAAELAEQRHLELVRLLTGAPA